MSNDGANMGVDSERALKTILGGEPSPEPPEDVEAKREDVRQRLEQAKPTSYNGASECIARAVLRLYNNQPETREWPAEQKYEWPKDENGNLVYIDSPTITGPNLWDAVKEIAEEEELVAMNGATGFMWGWAVNCARWLFDLPEVPNPAIVTIGGGE